MDIRGWLEDTATHQHGQHEHTATHTGLGRWDANKKPNSKRRRLLSSPLQPALSYNNGGPRPSPRPETLDTAGDCRYPGAAESARKGAYERKPRRKTREDLYDPKPDKERRPAQRHRPSARVDQHNRRHRRSARVRRDPGEHFVAKNVPAERLTACIAASRFDLS